jgi:NAD(P)-dependent dehydrogenase (short-subunit alcohol dehydrogenase family)
LAPYFAAKAAMDSLAVSNARELTRWGIETSIIVPGAFTSGTNHLANAGSPGDQAVLDEYEAGPYPDFGARVQEAFSAIVPADADVSVVADALVASARFGFTSIRPRTVRTSASRCWIGSGLRCCIASACRIC